MDAPAESPEIQVDDILFECPHCGKGLVIAPSGAGMLVTCPDCQGQLTVPGQYTGEYFPKPASNRPKMPETMTSLKNKLELVKRELDLIQAALDRIATGLGG